MPAEVPMFEPDGNRDIEDKVHNFSVATLKVDSSCDIHENRDIDEDSENEG
jgi:hypothetical protein